MITFQDTYDNRKKEIEDYSNAYEHGSAAGNSRFLFLKPYSFRGFWKRKKIRGKMVKVNLINFFTIKGKGLA